MESILAEYGIQGGSLALALAFIWYTIKGNRKAADDDAAEAKRERKAMRLESAAKHGELSAKQDSANESITILSTEFKAHTREQEKTNRRHSSSIKDLYERTNALGGK